MKLPYPILADADGKVAKRWGVYLDKYGGIAARSVFLLDEKGKVAYADPEYSLKDDADHDALLKAVKAAKGEPAATQPGEKGPG